MKNVQSIRDRTLSYLPRRVCDRIEELGELIGLEEVRLRLGSGSSLTQGGRNVPLGVSLSREEMDECFLRVCDMALFAHRDDIARGFVALPFGVRVGVSGRARYDGGRLVGISEVSSLAFRIPSSRSDVSAEVYRKWKERSCKGMLISSAVGVGKTTLIRDLALRLSTGRGAMRVSIADERCEFISEMYDGAFTDILSGYRRADAVEIAVRALSPEVLIVDELSTERDAEALSAALGSGVSIIATTHGESIEGIRKRRYIRELLDRRIFELAVFLKCKDGRRRVEFFDI